MRAWTGSPGGPVCTGTRFAMLLLLNKRPLSPPLSFIVEINKAYLGPFAATYLLAVFIALTALMIPCKPGLN